MWQWHYNGTWVTCTPENQLKLAQNESHPSLKPIVLTNPFGQITGRLSDDFMHVRMVGDDEDSRTFLRRGPRPTESAMYVVVNRSLEHIIPYEAGRKLFLNGKPRTERTRVTVGTEHYEAHRGRLYKKEDGQLCRVHWKKSDTSKSQYETLAKSRYQWEFKGPFRWERVRAAVAQVSSELDDSTVLDEAFHQFDPELDVTEHGPYQFGDYLVSRDLNELAIRVMDAYHSAEPTEWQPFDAIANSMIEKARSEGRPVAHITARGHSYVLVFDSGSGASGQPPVVVRPLRYERILSSIEENFGRNRMRQLFDTLEELNINPRLFLMAVMTNESAIDQFIPTEAQERVLTLMQRGSMGTALQNQLPPLLEKYSECEVRLSPTEKLTPRPLDKDIKQTLVTGLRVPEHLRQHCDTFEQLIEHIRRHQAWDLGKGQHTCDICSAKTVVLGGHCGTAKACLKCWSDSLHSTQMQCPFCRQEVREAQLALVTAPAKRAPRARKKRKRQAEFTNAEQALAQIHQDQLYAHFKLDDSQSMRKWFTVLMRTGMLKNGQLPRNMQAKKSLRSALHEFNILN